MSGWQLAQFNIATAKFDDDDPRLAEFIDNLDRLNTLGDESPGSVWRFQSESGTSVDVKAYDNPRILLNLTVWDDLSRSGTMSTRPIMSSFSAVAGSGSRSTPNRCTSCGGARRTPSDAAEGIARLEHLRAHGPRLRARFGTTTNLRPNEHGRSRRSRGCPVRVGCLRVRVRRLA